jgi:hypothetical protein
MFSRSLSIAALLWLICCSWQISSARTFHVAPDGDDMHDGSSREHAWRSVNHAAGRVRAGDTVVIAGGVYREAVRIRATGAPGQPITFKASPGETVVFDGQQRALGYAFYAAYQSHLRFDGLHFTGYNGVGQYQAPWADARPGNGNSGVFILHHCEDVQITRCLVDGRGPGYAGAIVMAANCPSLLVRNCASTMAMGGGVHILYSPGAVVEHCVFLHPLIYATIFQNNNGQPAHLRNNIFTDNLGSKAHVRLLYNSEPVDAGTVNNCFYVRTAATQRAWESAGTLQQWIDVMADRYGHAESQRQVAVNPDFAGALNTPELDYRGRPWFPADFLLNKDELNFADLFATNPLLIERKIGLQREAFADMASAP